MSEVIRGGVGGPATSSAEAWSNAFDALRRANDRMEDPAERRLLVDLGVAWARVASTMERTAFQVDRANEWVPWGGGRIIDGTAKP